MIPRVGEHYMLREGDDGLGNPIPDQVVTFKWSCGYADPSRGDDDGVYRIPEPSEGDWRVAVQTESGATKEVLLSQLFQLDR